MSELWRDAPAEPTFEEVYTELEETVQKLEEGGLTLEELLGLFERGMRLVRVCGARLDAAELRVSQLIARPTELAPRRWMDTNPLPPALRSGQALPDSGRGDYKGLPRILSGSGRRASTRGTSRTLPPAQSAGRSSS